MKFTSALFALAAAACIVTAAPSPAPWRGEGDDSGSPSQRGHGKRPHHPQTSNAAPASGAPSTSNAPSASDASSTTAPCPSESSSPGPTKTGGSSTNSTNGDGVVGSAYFITNDPDGNNIVAADIGSDGNVTFASVASTGGSGNHGDDGGLNAADATFSNGVIVVHADTQRLATTNPQSNTVVLFKINPENPSQLEMIGKPVSSKGEFPVSVAFNDAGDLLCVLNSGAVAGISCYSVTDKGLVPKDDGFRTLPRYKQNTPPGMGVGPIGTASQVQFSEDQKNVVVAIKGFITPQPTRGALIVWPIGDNFKLADDPVIVGTPAPGGFTFSLTPIPGKNAFFSADFSSGFDVWSFEGGIKNINSTDSTYAGDVPGELATCWSTRSPTLNSYYLSDPTACQLTEIVLDDDLNPTIVANHTFPVGSENIDVAVGTVGGKDYLYSLLANQVSVGVMRLDGTGDATLFAITNFTETVKKAGAPVRANFVQGMAVFMKPDSS